MIFALLAASLLLVGCSKDKSDTSVTENGACAVTKASSETSAPEISDKNESNNSDKKVNETAAGIKETKDTEGELPIVKEETSLESNKAEKSTAQVKNTDASTETKTQTSNTEKTTATVKTTTALTETEAQTSSSETEKTTGGVIELPIIPVK